MEMRLEYPKRLYHRDGRRVRVVSIDEHARYPLSDGWAESPAGPFEAPEPERPTTSRKRVPKE